ncbi:hypothetical protein ACFWD1_07325 [Micromonospora chalcea]
MKQDDDVDASERRRNALGRLVAHENTASDLLAFLFEIDPSPLLRLLNLDGGPYTCQREVLAGRGKGRLDLVLRRQDSGKPVAVLEMKGASDVHGDQLDRYNVWAESVGPAAPRRFYCTLDGDEATPPAPWQPLSLTAVFDAWQSCGDAHAAWLAREIVSVLRTWDAEADGLIGHGTGWYVPDLVSRRTATAVNAELSRAHDASGARASRTSGGNPMFMAWRRHPRGSGDARIGVDVRCEGRGAPQRPWLLRPCVDVLGEGQAALLEAHDLAVTLQPAMVLTAIRDALNARGCSEVAAALHANEHDGLAYPADPGVLADWRARIINGDQLRRRHPIFFHDRGLRLATQIRVQTAALTRNDLATMTMVTLDHLATDASP